MDLAVAVHVQCVLTDTDAGVLRVPAVGGSPGGGCSPLEGLLAAQDVLADDFAEGVSELPDAIGINEGVHNRVSVRQDNSQVHQPQGSVGTVWAEKGKAVNNVKGKPADCKQPNDDG